MHGDAASVKFMVGRGVLLDVAKYKGMDPLPSLYWITVDDLKNTAKAQKVEIQKGDVLLIRTGSMRRRGRRFRTIRSASTRSAAYLRPVSTSTAFTESASFAFATHGWRRPWASRFSRWGRLVDEHRHAHRAGLDPARPVKRGGRFSRKAATPSARSGVRAAIAWFRASMFRTSSSDMPSPW